VVAYPGYINTFVKTFLLLEFERSCLRRSESFSV